MMEASLTAALRERYELHRELGRGGMATVYLAHDVRHERAVAIKVLHPDLGAVLGAERFLSEIKTTAQLQHPHILPLLDSGAVEGLLYYVMPLVTGETLRARLERERQLPIDEAVRLAREVASALDFAHRQGVIHRDIKPENILLQDGAAVVADFGIALAVSNAGGQRVTQTGLSLGTPQYMSPEQATGDRLLDARSDLYSLGAVVYEMLTGEPPHAGATAQAVIARLLTDEPRALTTVRKQVPPHVEAAVLRALQKLPADRYASAREFAEALVDARGSGAVPARSMASRRWPMLAGAAVIAAVAFGAAALLPINDRAGGEPAYARPLLSVDVVLPDTVDVGYAIPLETGDRLFVQRQDGRAYLYSLTNRSLEPVNVEGLGNPGISPRGTWLADRVRLTNLTGRIRLRATAGGPVQEVADTVLSSAWADDSSLIVSTARGSTLEIRRVSAVRATAPSTLVATIPMDAGDSIMLARVVTDRRGSRAVVQPTVMTRKRQGRQVLMLIDLERGAVMPPDSLPGGHTVWAILPSGYLISSLLANSSLLFATPIDFGTGRLLGAPVPVPGAVNPGAGNGMLAYVPRPAVLLAASDRTGTLRPLPMPAEASLGSPAVSPDGGVLAYGVQDFASATKHVVTYALPSGPPTRVASFRGRPGQPIAADVQWAPDGRSIYSFEFACSCIMRTTRDGTRSDTVAPRASLRTRAFSLVHRAAGGERLVALNEDGLLLIDVQRDSVVARLPMKWSTPPSIAASPDGKWVAIGRREGSALDVQLVSFEHGTQQWRIPVDGASNPSWSPGGRRLYFVARDTVRVADLDFTPLPTVRGIRSVFRLGTTTYGIGVLAGDTGLVVRAPASLSNRVTLLLNFDDEVARLVRRP